MTLYIILVVLIILLSVILFTFFKQPSQLSRREEDRAAHLVHILDTSTEESNDFDLKRKRAWPRGMKDRYAISIAREVRAKWPRLMEKTKAHELQVEKRVVDIMTEHGVRPTHVQGIAVRAIFYVFLPTLDDVEVRKMNSSYAVQTRRNEVQVTWVSRWWRNPLPWHSGA